MSVVNDGDPERVRAAHDDGPPGAHVRPRPSVGVG